MTDDAKTLLAIAVLLLGGVGLPVGCAVGLKAWECSTRWSESGMRTSWGPIKGCTVEAKPGRWIPADRYREVQ